MEFAGVKIHTVSPAALALAYRDAEADSACGGKRFAVLQENGEVLTVMAPANYRIVTVQSALKPPPSSSHMS